MGLGRTDNKENRIYLCRCSAKGNRLSYAFIFWGVLATPAHFSAITGLLPFAEKLLVRHDRPVRMSVCHMLDICIVFRHAHHQPQALADIAPCSRNPV